MTKTFPASLSQLYHMLHFVREQAASIGFNDSHASKIELAVEEAIVNIIHYGYPRNRGTISITCHLIKEGLQIQIQDKGIPFDPTAHRNKTTFNPESIGGHGVLFIFKCMDLVTYERKHQDNVLTLTKFF